MLEIHSPPPLQKTADPSPIVGVLLAAGASRRYGKNKLTERLLDGESIAIRACRNLMAATPEVIVVTRPASPIANGLRELGARVIEFEGANAGMGASLARGIEAAPHARGWIVALGDMPFIRPETILLIRDNLLQAGGIVAPCHQERRGHPVGFDQSFGAELSTLSSDQGARSIIAAHRDELVLLEVEDSGIFRDVDTPADLR